ncbi:MAG: hypothetical protein AB7G10_24725 [Reyranellaceae bacterium]
MPDPNPNTLHEIHGAEIFKAGVWNGETTTVADLDAMVAAFNEVGFRPPLKRGHDRAEGQPALGWVSRIWRVGTSLFADIVDITPEVYAAIRRREYDNVSIEAFFNMRRNGRVFPMVLKALGLLGGQTPAVDLMPLRTVVRADGSQTVRYVSAFRFPEEPPKQKHAAATDFAAAGEALDILIATRIARTGESYSTGYSAILADPAHADLVQAYTSVAAQGGAAGREVARLARSLQATAGGTFADAMRAVLLADAGLAMRYNEEAPHVGPARPEAGVGVRTVGDAGAEVAKRVAALREARPGLAYSAAMREVLAADASLRDAYAA